MVKITAKDFAKLVDLLKKQGMDQANLTFRIGDAKLHITTMDRQAKEMIIELSDSEYPFMPRVTRTETF